MSWTGRALAVAELVSEWSKDPSTKVGCVIMRPDHTIASVGYNGFPRGVEDKRDRLIHRPTKYAMTVHAEPNAIVNARERLDGYSLYVFPFPPCSNCASVIIQAGIIRVIAPQPTTEQVDRWGDSFAYASQMFHEAEVELVLV